MHTRKLIWNRLRTGLPALLLVVGACTNLKPDARPAEGEEDVWAIRCAALRGSDHARRAESCAAALKRVRGLKADRVRVVEKGYQSIVYYGWYRREYDSTGTDIRFRPDQLPDLNLIRSLSVTINGRPAFPFIYATMEEVPTTPSQRPEWNLAQVNGYWSLQIAVFFNTETITNRRYLAEAYCQELRGKGEEAYYHHGAVNSIVCVGLFPKRAVQTFNDKDPWTGQVIAVDKIVDEHALDLQRRYPECLQNGHRLFDIIRDPKTGEIKNRVPLASFLVKLPRAEQSEQAAGG